MSEIKNPTCIFVVKGREAFRKEMPHPGMGEFIAEWDEKRPTRAVPSGEMVKCKGRFYWDHIDAQSNQVFRMCEGFQGEVL